MDYLLKDLISSNIYSLSGEIVSFISFIIFAGLLLLSLRLFGKSGLISFVALAFLASNIQVLHQAKFSTLTEPVALGTILFSLTFVASDMLTEHFGAAAARKAVLISIFAQLSFAIMMLTTLFHPPLDNIENQKVYSALETLFLPTPRILFASLVSYLLSQLLDIWVFQKIRILTKDKFLWMRSGLSTLLSAFADNVIFSTLAWIILSPDPVSFHSLIFTYILGTFIGRAFVSVAAIPLMYLSYQLVSKNDQRT